MVALYLDEDIPITLADLLRTRGHDPFTTRGERRLGSPDPEQLLFAANGGLTLVTHNRGDFARLHEAWLTWTRGWGVERAHAGIIVLGRVLGKPPEEYADLLSISCSGRDRHWPMPTIAGIRRLAGRKHHEARIGIGETRRAQ